jgi:hypothetical protein
MLSTAMILLSAVFFFVFTVFSIDTGNSVLIKQASDLFIRLSIDMKIVVAISKKRIHSYLRRVRHLSPENTAYQFGGTIYSKVIPYEELLRIASISI